MQPSSDARSQAERLLAFYQPVGKVRFVEAGREEALSRLGVSTVGDLLTHVPFRYIDLRQTSPIGPAPLGDVTVVGTVHDIVTKRPKKNLTVTEVHIVDDTGLLIGVWFKQPWVERSFRVGEPVAFSGTITLDYGFKRMVNPFVEHIESPPGQSSVIGKVIPVHPTTEKLALGWLRRIIGAAVDDLGWLPEYLPPGLLERRGLVGFAEAIRSVHFPETPEAAQAARRRLAYSELLDYQVAMARRRHRNTVEAGGTTHVIAGQKLAALRAAMPFALTAEQDVAVTEILNDMSGPHPMSRMLMGDVGTGKTAVGAHALAAVADTGTQAAMMAPTEVLAQQYAAKVGPLLDEAGVTWALLTGSTKLAARRELLPQIKSGAVSVVFGTHALLEDKVAFGSLSLVVIDEQHRFGVAQRHQLRGKGVDPDVLVMSATPIPRSLALTAYGDLAVSTLRSRPVRGAGTTTELVKVHQAHRAHQAIREAVREGRQAYVVCALVDESSQSDLVAANTLVEQLASQVFPDLRLAVLTGKMASAEKDAVMAQFHGGEIDVLVSTTVIEVGVDVPNATVMAIYNADRFGLAQLHQLRGRVGRGAYPGSVFLVSDNFSAEAKRRFQAVLSTDDGFKLAELDLAIRGAGELLGVRQHGVMGFRIANIAEDTELIEAARHDAFEIVAADADLAQPHHQMLEIRVRAVEAAIAREAQAG